LNDYNKGQQISMTTNNLWVDIQWQAKNLEQVIGHLLGAERSRLEAAADSLRDGRPITFIGLGSAAYLCMPAEIFLQSRGILSSVIVASEAYYNLLPSLKFTNVVINSRSGETIEVVRLGQALVENGIPFTLITNEPDSSLARMAARIIWAHSRADELVSINIVTAMMLTTLLLAAAVVNELDAWAPDVRRLPLAMEEVIQRAGNQAEAIGAYFKDTRPVYLLYRGVMKGAAYNGRLVLEEVSRTPGIAMEAGDFRQGPNEVVDERFGALVFLPLGRQGSLNLSLGQDILDSGGKVMLVGNSHAGVEGALNFPIAGFPDELLTLLAVVPTQVLAYKLAESQGYAPGDVRYISKVIMTEEGIPNQKIK
jgi:glucosamine--fructose-6-phosphate aminotransferase (isomerizing)